MSEENVDLVRRAYEAFAKTGDMSTEFAAEDFVWDMSTFGGWPEQQTYEGVEGARKFLAEWTSAFDDWQLDLERLVDCDGDKVLAVLHQRGRSRETGLEVEMSFAQLWTVRDGKEVRMEMYSDIDAAYAATSVER